MKKVSILSLFFAMLLLLAVPFASANNNKFTDVGDVSWALDAINELSSKKIITGYEDNSFRPLNKVTRADAAVMIARALKLDTENVKTVPFKDVDSNHYAYKSIAAVYEAKIMNGKGENNFNPNDSLTRGEMAKVLANAFNLTKTASNSFSDVSKDYFAYDAINSLVAYDITTGYPDKTFKPNQTINRAEFAKLLSKTLTVQSKPSAEQKEQLAKLLAEIQNNEINLDSYEFTGNAEISLSLPDVVYEDATDEETAALDAVLSMFDNIQVNMSGAYVKDPMHLEMVMKIVLDEKAGLVFEIPVIMTEDAMYMKMGGMLGGSDEKFIKMNLAELAEMSEQDAAALDMELQLELSKMINDMVTKHFIDFYSEVDLSTVEIEYNPNAQKAIKFEVTNDSIEPFIQVLFENLMPELLELMQNPEYSTLFGLTTEDLELLAGEDFTFDISSPEFKEMIAELKNMLTINELSSYTIIDANNIALDTLLNADVAITIEGETLGIQLNAVYKKQNINEDVTFQFEIPADEDTMSLDELYEFDEDYDFTDEDFEFELE